MTAVQRVDPLGVQAEMGTQSESGVIQTKDLIGLGTDVLTQRRGDTATGPPTTFNSDDILTCNELISALPPL